MSVAQRLAVSEYLAPPALSTEGFFRLLAERGVGGVGLTARSALAAEPRALRRLLDAHGLRASSLNSAGYVLHADPKAAAAQAALDDRLFALAGETGAPVNLIPGGLLHAGPDIPLAEARARAAEGIARLAARAEREGVRLSLEPFHPMAIGLRGCISQAADALAAIAPHPSVGLTLDLHHSWWDSGLAAAIASAGPRILAVQICGVVLPADGAAPRRGEMSEGRRPELLGLLRLLRGAGYDGLLEYEVFHDQMGSPADVAPLLDRALSDFAALLSEAAA